MCTLNHGSCLIAKTAHKTWCRFETLNKSFTSPPARVRNPHWWCLNCSIFPRNKSTSPGFWIPPPPPSCSTRFERNKYFHFTCARFQPPPGKATNQTRRRDPYHVCPWVASWSARCCSFLFRSSALVELPPGHSYLLVLIRYGGMVMVRWSTAFHVKSRTTSSQPHGTWTRLSWLLRFAAAYHSSSLSSVWQDEDLKNVGTNHFCEWFGISYWNWAKRVMMVGHFHF